MSNSDQDQRCFVISPTGEAGSDIRRHADMTLNAIVKPVLADEFGYAVERADESSDPGMITDKMIVDILNNEIVVADMSYLNPNVFYEIGLRHMSEKPIIQMCMTGTKIPFDNSDHRAIGFDPYDWHSQESAKSRLREFVQTIQKDDFSVSNPITRARGHVALTESADEKDRIISDLMSNLSSISQRVNTLELEIAAETLNRRFDVELTDQEVAKLRATGLLQLNERPKLSAASRAKLAVLNPRIGRTNLSDEDDLIALAIEVEEEAKAAGRARSQQPKDGED